MDILEQIIKIIGGLGQVGTLIVAVLLYNAGFFDNFAKKKTDGKTSEATADEDKKLTDLKLSIDTIQNNHLSHLSDKLDKIIEQNQEQLFILRDIKDNQKTK